MLYSGLKQLKSRARGMSGFGLKDNIVGWDKFAFSKNSPYHCITKFITLQILLPFCSSGSNKPEKRNYKTIKGGVGGKWYYCLYSF